MMLNETIDAITSWSGVGPAEVQTWPVVSNGYHALALVAFYYITVYILTAIMKNRKEPFTLTLYSQIHNLCMVAISLYMGLEYGRRVFVDNLTIYGNEVGSDDSYLPHSRMQWIFLLSKVPEFNDTFIMILKKNFRQVSVLHLYHHGSIFLFCLLAMYKIPGGDCWLAAFINSWIHVIMYSYYFCAPLAKTTRNPLIRLVVSMKKFITIGQLIQFLVVFSRDCYVLYRFYIAKDLEWKFGYGPIGMYWTELVYMMTMVGLFANFYVNSYSAKPQTKKE